MKHSTLFGCLRRAGLLCVGAMGFAAQAQALNITPSSAPQWTTNINAALFADDVESLTGYTGDLVSAYKMDYGGSESGPGTMYYTTAFTGLGSDGPTGATISWDGGSWIDCPDCFLVVKDGKQVPAAYVFDLGSWDGKETITLSGFWEDAPGAISYVEIFGSTTDGGPPLMVPEAETYAMMLAGLGLVGFAAARRRRG